MLNEWDSSFVQRDIQSSHTNTEETFFEQDSNMVDRDDRNTNFDQENVIFRLLGTLEEGQRMQQEQNRQTDMMLQLMAREIGIDINPSYANNRNNNNRGNDNGGRDNINGNNGHDNNGNEANNFRHVASKT